MSGISCLVQNQEIPRFIRVRQKFDQSFLTEKEIRGQLLSELHRKGLLEGIKQGPVSYTHLGGRRQGS